VLAGAGALYRAAVLAEPQAPAVRQIARLTAVIEAVQQVGGMLDREAARVAVVLVVAAPAVTAKAQRIGGNDRTHKPILPPTPDGKTLENAVVL
jgi:hypothetical protein